ncbi:HlyD family secretion protein [Microbulbifer sp. JSM ZJ756]|uniref:HlyD family secretion protein n=1 Tax=Microbulbifer sp. JSM ZJ756 TaxID=3376191 RepID=UPI0037CB4AA9
MSAVSGLFRNQVLQRQADRLHGEILLLPRLSHLAILALLLIWVIAVVAWLCSSNYARQETVQGWLEPASGVVRVYTDSPGIIKQVLVEEGESVVEGHPLIVVNGDRILDNGKHLESLLLAEYKSQRQLLNEQLARSEKIYRQQLQDIQQQTTATRQDLSLLEKQIVTHTRRYTLISEQAERYRILNDKGHVSSAELESVLAQELEMRAERQSLERNRVKLQSQIQQLKSKMVLLPEEHADVADQLRARLSDLAQRVAQLHGKRAYIVKASRAGVVSNLQAEEGQQAQTGVPVLSLVPDGQALTAQLLVPVRSAGFLDAGQSLNIRYDAFPFQKFGLYSGSVLEVSDTVMLPDELLNTPVSVREPVFKVSAQLSQPSVRAYGENFPLKPGMTLSADVQLAERSLLQWLLEPIYSLKGRL